ncbi:MAG: RNA polymerase sigma-70 factor (ECF subfamily) [Psychroserpens sp.]|jgi:RNA polymerase sigma-70 factor (ECF subfamily)
MEEIKLFLEKEKETLLSFIFRMTRNKENAEDIFQDTLLTVIEKKSQFKNNAKLKTWIFTIASNKTIDFLRKDKRWADNVMDTAKDASLQNKTFFDSLLKVNQTSPQGIFEVKEHIDLCFTCISKSLQIERQLALILKDIYDFSIKEIAEILNKTTSQVKHNLEDARAKMIDIYDKRCALINKKGICNQCSELNGIFNAKQDFEHKKMELKFAKDSDSKSKEELYSLRNLLVKSIDPLNSTGNEFQQLHLDFICKVAEKS